MLDAEDYHERKEDAFFQRPERRRIDGRPPITRPEHNELRMEKNVLTELVESANRLGEAGFSTQLCELVVYVMPIGYRRFTP